MSEDRLRLEYGQTLQLTRSLREFASSCSFFVPTLAGFGVGFLGKPRCPAAELLAVGLIGLVATVGIFIYELCNSQIYAGAVPPRRRARAHAGDARGPRQPPDRTPRTDRPHFRLLAVWQNRGLALVCGAALGGWMYLFAWARCARSASATRETPVRWSPSCSGRSSSGTFELTDRHSATTESRPASSPG